MAPDVYSFRKRGYAIVKNKTKKIKLEDGSIKRVPADMCDLLNYNILKLLNKAQRKGFFDMPVLNCNTNLLPDFLALSKQKSLYTKTPLTAVSFYEYDKVFDGENGLYDAIKYNKKKRLEEFKEQFKDVRFIIGPDLSVFRNVHNVENIHRIFRARIICLWFILEMNKVVIPNISYFNEEWFKYCIDGLEECKTIAISAKGHIKYPNERRLFKKVIEYVVDNIKDLQNIVVYSVCKNDQTCLDCFKYAIDKGINIVIPDNTLRNSNMKRGDENVG